VSAETSIAHDAPGHVRIVVREGGPGVEGYLGFVIIIAAAIYALMPAARANPLPLLLVLAIALAWAVIARTAREVYLLDGTARSLTASYESLFGRREKQVSGSDVTSVRLARGGPNDDRLLVELMGRGREVRLRLPKRVNTLSASDQQEVGRLVAEHLGVPLQAT
jgi:hypothetical protein